MELRVHSRNNLKISVLNINLTKFRSNDSENKKTLLDNLLRITTSRKINLIQLPLVNTDFLKLIVDWERRNNFLFNKCFLFGFPERESDTVTYSFTRDELYDNRFQNIENELKKLIDDFQINKIEFLTLIYPKITHFEKYDLQSIIKRIKDTNIVNSIGIHCQNLSDALLFCKKFEIDHIEIELDINSSLELINSIFKVTESKNIAVFCHLNDNSYDADKSEISDINSLSELLIEGGKISREKIASTFFIKEDDIGTLTLRKYLPYDFLSFTISSLDENWIKKFWNCLTIPYLTNEDQINLKNVLDPQIYESPKKSNQINKTIETSGLIK